MRPLIGISGRLVKDLSWSPNLVGHRQGYVEAILQAGGLPVILPPATDETALRGLFDRMDGIMLAGGEDIAPEKYREPNHPNLGEVSWERDTAELPLARWAVAEGKPLLGICRGIQVINVALGGTLWQDIPAQCPGSFDHEVSAKEQRWESFDHGVSIDQDSRLAEILGVTNIEVNSLHHQAVKEVAQGLRVVGTAPDGIVEAVEGTGEAFLVAVQCHPEELWRAKDTRWRQLFAAFVTACQTVPAKV